MRLIAAPNKATSGGLVVVGAALAADRQESEEIEPSVGALHNAAIKPRLLELSPTALSCWGTPPAVLSDSLLSFDRRVDGGTIIVGSAWAGGEVRVRGRLAPSGGGAVRDQFGLDPRGSYGRRLAGSSLVGRPSVCASAWASCAATILPAHAAP
jgi:hypothetical protein